MFRTLGPGAETLLKVLTDKSLPPEQQVDISTQVRKLNVSDWALIIRAFHNWPFAPEVSYQFSTQSINKAHIVITDAFITRSLYIPG